MKNLLEHNEEFSLTLANPNPSSSKTKEGPRYRVSFELTQEEWQLFMDTETSGMVLECQAVVTHRNIKNEQELKPEKKKKGPYSNEARELMASGFFNNPIVQEIYNVKTPEEAKECLKNELGYDHLYDIPPIKINIWASHLGLFFTLPQCYKDSK